MIRTHLLHRRVYACTYTATELQISRPTYPSQLLQNKGSSPLDVPINQSLLKTLHLPIAPDLKGRRQDPYVEVSHVDRGQCIRTQALALLLG